ncbi:MAG: FliH/SctL family protein [Candidatus Eisenbacteria bacterium]|nr:FliH/SctL family protein [Candidatus Eisenbacteria bacterium]
MRDLVGRAIEMLHVDEPVEGRLHPADLEILTPEIEALASRGRARTIHWLADPTMERGGFVLEGANQILDGRLDLAIRSIHERLEFD